MAFIGSSALNGQNNSIENQHVPLKFDAGDLLRFKLEMAFLIIEESPRLDTLCHAFYAAQSLRRSEVLDPLTGFALQDPINRPSTASKRPASRRGGDARVDEAVHASAFSA